MSTRIQHSISLRDVLPPKLKNGQSYTGNQQYRGNGRMRSCCRCGKHSPEHTGAWRPFLGRSQWHGACHAGRAIEYVAQATNGEAQAATNSPGLISQPSPNQRNA